jgi:hypothetical protein
MQQRKEVSDIVERIITLNESVNDIRLNDLACSIVGQKRVIALKRKLDIKVSEHEIDYLLANS